LNPRFCEMLGYTQEELLTKTVAEITHPDDHARIWPAMQSIISGEVPSFFQEKRYLRRDGSCFWSSTSVSLVRDGSGQIEHALAVIRDISDRKKAEAALRESEERLRLVTENMSDLVCLHHPDGRYMYVTSSCKALLGYCSDELIGRDPYELFHPNDRKRIRQETHTPSLNGTPRRITYRIRQKTGDYIWVETLTKTILDAKGQVVHLQSTSREVSDRIEAEHKLKHDALHDSLTGLPNRNLLMERLDLAFKRAQRHREYQFALLFLDLDNFKAVNDSMGHLIGDELLLAVVTRLDKCIRETDLVARLGGDEFVILLEELNDLEESVRVAERILESLQSPFHLSSRELFTSTSIGIAVGSISYKRTENLLRDADLAMYRAKKSGRGQYAIFDPAMHFQVVQRLELEHDLRKALANDELTIYYQPIVELKTMVIKGFEALIRWQHPQRGFVSPGEFIEIAEETELIMPIGQWILHTACQQLAAWQAQFSTNPLQMSVNLSVKQMQSSLLPELEEVLTTYNLQENSLGLEITESMLVENVEVTLKLLNQIKAKGIYLSIDDFGTGYSSLSYLTQLPVDTLKIDRAFVSRATTDHRNQIIAESVIALSNLLDLKAIAEGIETEQQLEWLKRHGCELGQGFLFSPPVPAELATEMLKKTVQFGS
ncbi:MAG: EAL domain-containing protein, partial [Xenococcus sp. MO_188.B8]|nr:EAL domain-containing protein [Xenococcus sp. MO_188.B8]